MLEREPALRDELNPAWAVRPLALTTHGGRAALILEDPGGELLGQRVGTPMDVADVLRVGAGAAGALRHVHGRGLVHQDVQPAKRRAARATGQECPAHCEAGQLVDTFARAEDDTPIRLVSPEKLYGRAREIDTLLGAFERVVTSGTPELVLVSGYSGIGKSSVVNELHKVLVPPRGLFASGKFDQYKRDIPYATLVQAFQSLLRPLLTKGEAELSKWRDALRQALNPNGQLIVDLVPELRLIIGDQAPVPELPLQDARRRFHMVFRSFISVFARPEHPLALFLDDLQWLDAATLVLIEDVFSQADVRHLMLIGAYRDNEVDATHPLMRKLEAIRQRGAIV